MDARVLAQTILFAAVGGAIGWAYCVLVRHTVEGIAREDSGMLKFFVLMVLRVLLVACGFGGAAYFGVWPAVGNVVGFFIVRTAMVKRSRIGALAAEEAAKIRQAREERQQRG